MDDGHFTQRHRKRLPQARPMEDPRTAVLEAPSVSTRLTAVEKEVSKAVVLRGLEGVAHSPLASLAALDSDSAFPLIGGYHQ